VTVLLEDDPARVVVEQRLCVVQREGEHAQREHVGRRRQFDRVRIVTVFRSKKIEIWKNKTYFIIDQNEATLKLTLH